MKTCIFFALLASAEAADLLGLIRGVGSSAVGTTAMAGDSAGVAGDLSAASAMHMEAANLDEDQATKEILAGIRAAMTGSGAAGGSSAGKPSSFLAAGPVSSAALHQLADDVAATAASRVPFQRMSSCQQCRPNFDACPTGWQADRAGSCTAPSTYSGYCNRSINFSGFSDIEREEAEIFCDFCHPCA